MQEKKKRGKKHLINIKSIDEFEEIFKIALVKEKVEVEIGSGNGHFITEYCLKNNNSFVIGIEKKRERCSKIVRKLNKRNLQNAEIIQGSAEELLKKLPSSRIDAFHIYFPDPWPKARHRKRRFFKMTSLNLLAESLKEGGRVHFASDYFDYALQVKILLHLHGGFRLIESAPPEEAFLSVYANKFNDLKREIRFLTAVKIS